MSRFERAHGAPSLALVVSHDPVERGEEILNRYEIDPGSHRRLKRAGETAAHKMLAMLENEAQFNELSQSNKLKLIDMALSRAFGNVENQSAEVKLQERREASEPQRLNKLQLLASKIDLPELAKARKAQAERTP